MTRRSPEGAFAAADTIPRRSPHVTDQTPAPGSAEDAEGVLRDVASRPHLYTATAPAAARVLAELAAARAEIERLRTENRQLRYRLDEMDVRAGEILNSPVVDGRTSVRLEYVEALRATMQRPLDQEEMPR